MLSRCEDEEGEEAGNGRVRRPGGGGGPGYGGGGSRCKLLLLLALLCINSRLLVEFCFCSRGLPPGCDWLVGGGCWRS